MGLFFRLDMDLQMALFDMLDFSDRRARCSVCRAMRADTSTSHARACYRCSQRGPAPYRAALVQSISVALRRGSNVMHLPRPGNTNSVASGPAWRASTGPSGSSARITPHACASTRRWSCHPRVPMSMWSASAAGSPGTPSRCAPCMSGSRCVAACGIGFRLLSSALRVHSCHSTLRFLLATRPCTEGPAFTVAEVLCTVAARRCLSILPHLRCTIIILRRPVRWCTNARVTLVPCDLTIPPTFVTILAQGHNRIEPQPPIPVEEKFRETLLPLLEMTTGDYTVRVSTAVHSKAPIKQLVSRGHNPHRLCRVGSDVPSQDSGLQPMQR